MAAPEPVTISCPTCKQNITVPLIAQIQGQSADQPGHVLATVEADFDTLRDHIATHVDPSVVTTANIAPALQPAKVV